MSREDTEQKIGETQVNAPEMIQDAYPRHLERKRASAARKIQTTYRRYLKWKSVVLKRTHSTKAHYSYRLRRRSVEVGWDKDSQYSVLFRYPLGYIIACLNVTKRLVESASEDAKKRTMTEGDKDAAELTETLNNLRYDSTCRTLCRGSNEFSSKLLEKTIALQEKLAPSSTFHEKQSVSDL